MMYLAWAYAFARGDYLCMIICIPIFSLSFAWVSYVFAMRALYLHKYNNNTEFRNQQDLKYLIRKKGSLESELQKANERIAELSR